MLRPVIKKLLRQAGILQTPPPPPKDRIIWDGPFSSWEEASGKSGGYSQQNILEITSAAIQKVAAGEAAFERDSVLFDEPEYPWALISSLHQIACKGNEINVVDFGGSLGSTYFQVRKLLKQCYKLNWQVVEQEHYVAEGNKMFASGELKFHSNISTIPPSFSASATLILSGVLNYLEDWQAYTHSFLEQQYAYILIDRTLVSANNSEFILVQKVPPAIYEASYPCRVLSSSSIESAFSAKYQLVYSWRAHEALSVKANGQKCIFKGFLFKKAD